MDTPIATEDVPVWSWVSQPEDRRPQAARPGRYSRPLSIRDKTIAKAFGQEVRRLRLLKKDMTTYALAKLVGMSQPAIVKIETGVAPNIELRLMWDFADVLGVDPKHFLKVCEEAAKTALAKFRLEQRYGPPEAAVETILTNPSLIAAMPCKKEDHVERGS